MIECDENRMVNPTPQLPAAIYYVDDELVLTKADVFSKAILDKLMGQECTGQPVCVALAFGSPIELLENYLNCFNNGNFPVILNPKIPYAELKGISVQLGCEYLRSDQGECKFDRGERFQLGFLHHFFCSSGTSSLTGNPKINMYPLRASVLNASEHMQSLGFKENDGSKVLLPMSISHSFGFVAGVLGCVALEVDLYIAPLGLTPKRLLSVVENNHIDCIYLIPSQVRVLLTYLKRNPSLTLPTLKRISIGSSILYCDELVSLMSFFPSTKFYSTYGLSEMGPRVSTFYAGSGAEPHEVLLRGGHLPVPMGKVLGGVQVKVEEESLWVKSTFCALNIKLSDDGYYCTEDCVKVDDSNGLDEIVKSSELRIYGRLDDTIVRSGVNIYPTEIEGKLSGVQGLGVYCIFGISSKTYGMVPVLAYEKESGVIKALIEGKIIDGLKEFLPESHMPVKLHNVENIPRSALGKIMRKRLSKQLGYI